MCKGSNMDEIQVDDLASFEWLFGSKSIADAARKVSPTSYSAAAEFWRVPLAAPHLSPRMKELILFAMHASATALNNDAIKRQVKRVFAAGGTAEDIVDVLISITALANHSLYSSVPILEEEWAASGRGAGHVPSSSASFEAAKQRFEEIRGFWNSDRDAIARQMPDYFTALTELSIESWCRGPLTRKEREFICIAIDCTVTHSYAPGLRIHIRNAIKEGATCEEILEIFQLAALMGLEGFVLTANAMFGETSP
jgi:alkylhydroperoxidase/carboxymuconolactone decarboxylase family protein YurZ